MQDTKQFRCGDFGDWLLANPWENVALEEPNLSCGVGRCPAWGKLDEPLPRYLLEAVCGSARLGRLFRFAALAWVDTLCQYLPLCVPALTRGPQGRFGVYAKGNSVFFAVEAVFQPPPFATRGLREKAGRVKWLLNKIAGMIKVTVPIF